MKFWTNRDRREAGGAECLVTKHNQQDIYQPLHQWWISNQPKQGKIQVKCTRATWTTTTTTTGPPDGVLTSPNYPGKYPNKYSKTKTIQGDAGTVLILEFTAFNVESHASCRNDYLKIRDGDGSTLLGKTCGSSLPEKILSNTNVVKIDFKTNSKKTKTGWRILWRAVALKSFANNTVFEFPSNFTSLWFGLKFSCHQKMWNSFDKVLGVDANDIGISKMGIVLHCK